MSEPDPERIRSAIETIVGELGDVSHLEINHYEFNNGDRYTNFYCPGDIPDVEESARNKYKLTEVQIEDKSAVSLVPLNE